MVCLIMSVVEVMVVMVVGRLYKGGCSVCLIRVGLCLGHGTLRPDPVGRLAWVWVLWVWVVWVVG